MKILVGKFEFKVSFVSILLYFFLLILLISLGFWQLERAEEKQLFLEKEQQSLEKSAIKLNNIKIADLENLRYRKTEMKGEYDQKHQFLIDNQIVNGEVGYFVLTPFIVDGLSKAVLINRGWVASNKKRSELPDISFNSLKSSLTGRINNFPVVGIKLQGADIPTEGWPSVVQVVDIHIISDILGYPLFPFQIELDAEIDNGYLRDWKKSAVISPEKHIAYSVQWFSLAMTLTVLFIFMSSKK